MPVTTFCGCVRSAYQARSTHRAAPVQAGLPIGIHQQSRRIVESAAVAKSQMLQRSSATCDRGIRDSVHRRRPSTGGLPNVPRSQVHSLDKLGDGVCDEVARFGVPNPLSTSGLSTRRPAAPVAPTSRLRIPDGTSNGASEPGALLDQMFRIGASRKLSSCESPTGVFERFDRLWRGPGQDDRPHRDPRRPHLLLMGVLRVNARIQTVCTKID
jgi:hypothetical protein